MPNPTQDLFLRCTWRTAPTTRSISGSSAATAQFASTAYGLYYLWSDIDCFFIAGTAPTATTSSIPLTAKAYFPINITAETDKVAVISSGAAGTLFLIKAE